jgi:hypothetical protein
MLGIAGGAGGVHQHRDLLDAVGRHRLRHRLRVQRTDMHLAETACCGCLSVMTQCVIVRLHRDGGRVEDAPRATVVADLVDLPVRQARVDDHGPGVDLRRAHQQGGEDQAVLADDHHAIAGTNAGCGQHGGGLGHDRGELGIGPGGRAIGDSGMVGGLLRGRRDHVADARRQTFQDRFGFRR